MKTSSIIHRDRPDRWTLPRHREPPALPGEEWRPVPSMPGLYASSLGRIFKRKASYGYPDREGYMICGARKNRRKVHRLVCEAFHGPAPEGRPVVAHLDGSKDNNRPENLVWASWEENSSHMELHGTRPCGEGHARSKLTTDLVKMIWLSPLSNRRLSAATGIGIGSISAVRTRNTWRHVTDALPPQPERRACTLMHKKILEDAA